VLDDAAATSIQSLTPLDAPITGIFKPASPLAAFTGENPSGTWTLHVSDSFPADAGNLRAFSIETSGFDCSP
jgi:subtilisin-like proprotein convertase family protein